VATEKCSDAFRQAGERQGGAAERQEIEITTIVTNDINLYKNKA